MTTPAPAGEALAAAMHEAIERINDALPSVVKVGDDVLLVHAKARCTPRPCVIHNPSAHHMRDWPTNYRPGRQITERVCPHGIGHPDPDDAAYRADAFNDTDTTHGCDGCCADPKENDQ